MSEETIEKLFNESEWNDLYHIDANEVVTKTAQKVFTLLMPIIEKQMEALEAEWPGEYGLIIREHHNKFVQEAKQMLENLMEGKC